MASSIIKLIVNCRTCAKDVTVIIKKTYNPVIFHTNAVCEWEIPCIKNIRNEHECPLDLSKTIANIINKEKMD